MSVTTSTSVNLGGPVGGPLRAQAWPWSARSGLVPAQGMWKLQEVT